MRFIRPFVALAFISCVSAVAASACVASNSEPLGQASLAIEQMPSDVSCVRVKVRGSSEVWRLYDIKNDDDAHFSLTGLPLGSATFAVQGFDEPCRAVGPFTLPRWTSQSLASEIDTKAPAVWIARLEEHAFDFGIPRLPMNVGGSPSNGSDGGVSGSAGGPDGGGSASSACFGNICLVFPGGGVSADGGTGGEGGATVDGGSASDGGPPREVCVGNICIVRRGPVDGGVSSPEGGTGGSSFCIGDFCLVPRTPLSPEGGTPAEGGIGSGGSGVPGATCLGNTCVVFLPGATGPESPDGGLPGTDGGSFVEHCSRGFCAFFPKTADGGSSGLPSEICGPIGCWIIAPRGSVDGGVAAGDASSGTSGGVASGGDHSDGGSSSGGAPPVCAGAACVVILPTTPGDVP